MNEKQRTECKELLLKLLELFEKIDAEAVPEKQTETAHPDAFYVQRKARKCHE